MLPAMVGSWAYSQMLYFWKRPARDKQSSLLGTFVNYIGKKFYNVPPDSQIGTFVYLFYI